MYNGCQEDVDKVRPVNMVIVESHGRELLIDDKLVPFGVAVKVRPYVHTPKGKVRGFDDERLALHS